jgi:hypothetical protein
VDFKIPPLEKIMEFKTSFLNELTRKAKEMHLFIIKTKWRSPDGKRFPKLTKKYAKEKQKKYGNKNPNLYASGLMFRQIKAKKPKRKKFISDITLSYGVENGATHPRNKGDNIPTADLLTFHADAVPPNKHRPITGKAGSMGSLYKAIHNQTRDMLVKDLVNQMSKNIKRALSPYSTKIDL